MKRVDSVKDVRRLDIGYFRGQYEKAPQIVQDKAKLPHQQSLSDAASS
jgi:hypothetical protein